MDSEVFSMDRGVGGGGRGAVIKEIYNRGGRGWCGKKSKARCVKTKRSTPPPTSATPPPPIMAALSLSLPLISVSFRYHYCFIIEVITAIIVKLPPCCCSCRCYQCLRSFTLADSLYRKRVRAQPLRGTPLLGSEEKREKAGEIEGSKKLYPVVCLKSSPK